MDKQNAVKTLVRLVGLCESGHSTGAAYGEHAFNPEEVELLILSADTGMFRVEASDYAPVLWITIQGSDGSWLSQKSEDPATSAIAVGGFERLFARGLIQQSEGALFVLNGEGFKKARSLQHERRQREEAAAKLAAEQERKRLEAEEEAATMVRLGVFILVVTLRLPPAEVASSSLVATAI